MIDYGEYSYDEKKKISKGVMKSSRLEIRGTIKELGLIFHDPRINRQRRGMFEFSPWFRSSVKRISR